MDMAAFHRNSRLNIAVWLYVIAAALVLALAVLVVGAGVAPTHHHSGCNHIPLVNGKPAYPCIVRP